jgi:mannose-6-phosphate isomerase
VSKPTNRIAVLKNPVRNYPWGSRTFIPQLLRNPSPAEKPQAELWMGVHPNGASLVSVGDTWMPLQDVIAKDPSGILGQSVAERFSNALPFLFKILAADQPLSLQAHPNREQACEGFAQENDLHIPLTAPHRTYKDENHKPEILCALRPFQLLKGFRSAAESSDLMEQAGLPLLGDSLRIQPGARGLRILLNTIMTVGRNEQRRLISGVIQKLKPRRHIDPAINWVLKLSRIYPSDIGVLAPLFLNFLRLEPGTAVYLRPGELHVYLEGAGVELMANSDNVMRGGLTTKPVNVPELLRIVDFTADPSHMVKPELREGEWLYPTPAEEFALSALSLHGDAPLVSRRERNVEIMICVEGQGGITDLGRGERLFFDRGTAVVVPADVEQYELRGEARIYKATVPH